MVEQSSTIEDDHIVDLSHGGGDSVITRSFMDSLDSPDHVPDARLKDALKSALLAFLCDEARDRGQVLPVTFTKDVEAIRD